MQVQRSASTTEVTYVFKAFVFIRLQANFLWASEVPVAPSGKYAPAWPCKGRWPCQLSSQGLGSSAATTAWLALRTVKDPSHNHYGPMLRSIHPPISATCSRADMRAWTTCNAQMHYKVPMTYARCTGVRTRDMCHGHVPNFTVTRARFTVTM